MEDKSDNDSSSCEDDLINKLSVNKGRSSGRVFHFSASVGDKTTSQTSIPAPSDQTKTSNPNSCEDEKLDGHDRFVGKPRNVQVKEEYASSGEEAVFSGEEAVFSGEGEDHVSSGEEAVFSGEGEDHVSSGEEQPVSSREEDTSSGNKGLGNIESLIVQDPPFKQHKRRRNILKLNIGRSKEISEDLRKQVVEAHKSGKGYKRISKDLSMHLSTVRKIVYKWKKFSTVATLPRSGRPAKIGAQARRTILKHMRENTRVTAKDLKASLALDNINVHESTIRKTMSKWCSWDFTMDETTALQQE